MSFIVRSMLPDGNKPAVGQSAKMLGVRVLPAKNADLPVDIQANVAPGTGGMSVAPDWRRLPPHRIPARLRSIARDASGDDKLVCWRLGDAAFIAGLVADVLVLRLDNPEHGLIEPSHLMKFESYTMALAGTVDRWVKIEGLE